MSKEPHAAPKPAPEPVDPMQSINEPSGSSVVVPPVEPKPDPKPAEPKHDEERRRR